MLRLATFNVENMFERVAIMNLPSWDEAQPVLKDFNRLNELIALDTYDDVVKDELLTLMKRNKGLLKERASEFIRLRDIRNRLVSIKKDGRAEIVAGGRGDWVGWFELEREPIKETATENTARVIEALGCDVLCVVEAESRTALKRFNEQIMPRAQARPFDHIMLIDGNDTRGIDVGMMSRNGVGIDSMVSHVDDRDEQGVVFSRDCPEYTLRLPSGGTLLLMVNHFKSKSGTQASSNALRRRQAARVRELYEARRREGVELIAIAGDFNDTPDSAPLQPLVAEGSSLVDVMTLDVFEGDGRPGTFGNGTKSGKFDYILLSPALRERVRAAGIERRGVWGGKNGTLFPHFPEIKSAKDAASDHAALWVDLDV